MRKWSQEQVDTLLRMHNNGVAPQQISKKLGKSKYAILNKLKRLGVEERFSEFHSDEFTAPHIAKLLGCSERTVHRWINNKELNSTCRGRWRLVRQKDLLKFCESHPERWVASRADKYYFGPHEFYQKKLADEQNGIKDYPYHFESKRWSSQENDICCRMIAQGHTVTEMSRRLGKSNTAIDKYISRNQLRLRENNKWIGRI